jgi:AraC-like DNA-binding protein
MITKSLLPPATLSGYVSSILVIEYNGGINNFAIPLFANGSPTITFHTAKISNNIGDAGHLSLYGQTISPGELRFDEPVTLIAYFLHAPALKALFGMDANELTDTSIAIHYLKQAREINLQEQLLNEPDISKRLDLINNFILKLAGTSTINYDKLSFATNALKNNSDANALSVLQNKLNTSERSLQRLFETNVGVSPKLFKRVWQFHAAFQQLNTYQFSKLTDVAYQHGFADQSHFIRVFKEFTHLTPKEYLQKAAPYNPKF